MYKRIVTIYWRIRNKRTKYTKYITRHIVHSFATSFRVSTSCPHNCRKYNTVVTKTESQIHIYIYSTHKLICIYPLYIYLYTTTYIILLIYKNPVHIICTRVYTFMLQYSVVVVTKYLPTPQKAFCYTLYPCVLYNICMYLFSSSSCNAFYPMHDGLWPRRAHH